MNEPQGPDFPQNPSAREPRSADPPPIEPMQEEFGAPPHVKPEVHWWKRLLACNPFYLVSVALLLYGCYRISLEPGIFGKESAHLVFNFSSLQSYEILLVVTAIFLARRRIWYDSTLLVGLENLLLLVPFILLTQAALLPDKEMIRAMGLIAGLMAALRLGSLKWLIGRLNFPPRLVAIGLAFVVVNVALTIIYRTLHESKFGTKLESGPAYETNEYVWMLLLPALCALALILPRTQEAGRTWPERAWIPSGLFGLWSAGTAVHLYCLGYVYDFSLRGELLAPAMWVIAWVTHARLMGFTESEPVRKRLALVLPILATLAASWASATKVFFILTLLNFGLYGRLFLKERENRLLQNLLLISGAALAAGFPESWGIRLIPNFGRGLAFGAGATVYLLIWAVRSIDPRTGIFGAIVSAIAALIVSGKGANAPHWAMQVGLIFLLLHSLRWIDLEHTGARTLRILAAALWVVHAVVWMHTSGQAWMLCVVGGIVWIAYVAMSLARKQWGPHIVPLTASLVLLAGPTDVGAGKLETIPIGVLSMIGSFLLFGVGTVVALMRHRWHKTDS